MTLRDEIAQHDENIVFFDGFDDALIGVARRAGQPPVACYSVQKMVEILSKDMSEEDALEYLEYNTFSAYVGEYTPVCLEGCVAAK